MTEAEEETRLFLEGLTCGCTGEDDFEALMRLLRFLGERTKRSRAKPLSVVLSGIDDEESFDVWSMRILPPEPWTYLPLNFLDREELIEHGTAIRYPWTTSKGEAVLAFLDKFGMDQEKW